MVGDEELQTFYDTTGTSNIGTLADAEKIMANAYKDSSEVNIDSLNIAMDLLNDINSNFDYEENLKQTLTLFASHTNDSGLSFSDGEKSYIDSVSVLCPYTAGEGVYFARGLRETYNGAIFYNDSLLCILNQGIPKTHPSYDALKTQFGIYPNPALDEIYYLISANETNPIYLDIVNAYGQELIHKEVSNHELSRLDVSQFSNGLYYVYLNSAKKRIALNKLVIAR